MKKPFAVLAVFFVILANIALADITVTLFGTGHFTETFSDFTDTQTATTFEIVGNDFGSQLDGSLPSSVNITGSNFQSQPSHSG